MDRSQFPRWSFPNWLEEQKDREDPIGDFARDATSPSANAPSHDAVYGEWIMYLTRNGASEEARQAFEDAWEEWAR